MAEYVGMDVSLEEVSICVLNDEGRVLVRGTTSTDPAAIVAFIAEHAPEVVRIVHESGQISIWLTRALRALGAPVICIDARMAHKALSARPNKSDKSDAEGLAQLARSGWYREVHVKSEASDRLRTLIGARDRLLRIRKDIEGHVRGVLKTYGIRLAPVTAARNRAGFRDQVQAVVEGDPVLEVVAASFIVTHDVVCGECAAIEDELVALARESTLARRLMTVPGVGPIVALSFIATIDDAARFAKSTQVGAYLGLMRTLLVEAASSVITRVKRFSPLKAWAVRLAARKGFKKAAVATARKLAVILHRIWCDGTTFAWRRQAATA
jgi:transposase